MASTPHSFEQYLDSGGSAALQQASAVFGYGYVRPLAQRTLHVVLREGFAEEKINTSTCQNKEHNTYICNMMHSKSAPIDRIESLPSRDMADETIRRTYKTRLCMVQEKHSILTRHNRA
jgi:hypothetical protein